MIGIKTMSDWYEGMSW